VDFRSTPNEALAAGEVFPAADELRGSERAVYEYLGLAWEKIQGKI
jgi:hypothetical protein